MSERSETTWPQPWKWSVVDQANLIVRHEVAVIALGTREGFELGLVVVDRLGCAERPGNQGAFLVLPSLAGLFQVLVQPLDVLFDVPHVPLLSDVLVGAALDLRVDCIVFAFPVVFFHVNDEHGDPKVFRFTPSEKIRSHFSFFLK